MNEQIDQLKNIEGAIEAILYAAGYPVKYSKIAEVLGLDLRNIKKLVEHMAVEFNSEKSKRMNTTSSMLSEYICTPLLSADTFTTVSAILKKVMRSFMIISNLSLNPISKIVNF